jgi:hypothetical protein
MLQWACSSKKTVSSDCPCLDYQARAEREVIVEKRKSKSALHLRLKGIKALPKPRKRAIDACP